jgi:hypothetical protein
MGRWTSSFQFTDCILTTYRTMYYTILPALYQNREVLNPSSKATSVQQRRETEVQSKNAGTPSLTPLKKSMARDEKKMNTQIVRKRRAYAKRMRRKRLCGDGCKRSGALEGCYVSLGTRRWKEGKVVVCRLVV